MAHSFISVNISNTERTICVTDSILHLFMYFFNSEIRGHELSQKEQVIYDHYELEIIEVHTSYIDLKLDEVSSSMELKKWYSSILDKLSFFIRSFGESIEESYLNGLSGLNKKFNKPIAVKKMSNLINDLLWLLSEENRCPSEEYKWMEMPIPN